jgi:excisionase family DNA binding protein
MPVGTISEELLHTTDVARFFDVQPQTIRKWVREGWLTFVRLPNGRYRFRRGDLERFTARYLREAFGDEKTAKTVLGGDGDDVGEAG